MNTRKDWCKRMSLEKYRKFKKKTPQNCTRTNLNIKKETSFCTSKKASLTLEATVIVPLVAGFFVSILFFFRVIMVQAYVDEAIIHVGKMVAVESSVVSSEEALFVSAEVLFRSLLAENTRIETFVDGGLWGITLLGSDLKGKEIVLRADYQIKLPIGFFGRRYVSLYSQNRFMKWQGNQREAESECWVYITPTGSVYHATNTCRVLDLSIHESTGEEISLVRGENGQKYYPCSGCQTTDAYMGIVYYTDYGRVYHQDISCKSLKRTVNKVDISSVTDRRPCSYCY